MTAKINSTSTNAIIRRLRPVVKAIAIAALVVLALVWLGSAVYVRSLNKPDLAMAHAPRSPSRGAATKQPCARKSSRRADSPSRIESLGRS